MLYYNVVIPCYTLFYPRKLPFGASPSFGHTNLREGCDPKLLSPTPSAVSCCEDIHALQLKNKVTGHLRRIPGSKIDREAGVSNIFKYQIESAHQ